MATGPQFSIDLSEETRLAQLRRIEELRGQIGDTTPLFVHQQPGRGNYAAHGYGRGQYPVLPPNIHDLDATYSGPATDVLVKNFTKKRSLFEDNLYGSLQPNVDLYDYNASRIGVESTEFDEQPRQEFDFAYSHMDVSDETPQSHRMCSTPSKASGSSNTSADGVDVKFEMNGAVELPPVYKGFSPASSLSSQLSPAKSTTPAVVQPPINVIKAKRKRSSKYPVNLHFSDFRPRTSIPTDIAHEELARQSIEAAYSSRLNPFALHPDEYILLRDHICHLHISAYINVRNRILRLWVRNPLVSVTAEEAAGCAYSSRWLRLAEVAYEWLLRRGYINFGCVEVPEVSDARVKKSKPKRRKTIVVVGAGMAGLGCARQLEGLFAHFRERWTAIGEEPPHVVLLEGRPRIGGRIYSHPLHNQNTNGIPKNLRSVAEMGAHIIIGFDHGNPLNMLIRGQLALHYYPLKDNSTLHDIDGQVVDKQRDRLVEKLFNDILDRASVYRHKNPPTFTVDGDRELIEAGRDPSGDAGDAISSLEEYPGVSIEEDDHDSEQVPAGLDKLTGKAHMVAGSRTKAHPLHAAVAMGWQIKSSSPASESLDLDKVVNSTQYPTLGMVMDEGVKHYQKVLSLSTQDLRILNWHFANLEYANAASVNKLSLGGWDQDGGNEFAGDHAQVIGGYQQVPRGLWQYPSKLDLRTHRTVKRIVYDPNSGIEKAAKVICEDGDTFDAQHVVLTAPLGVLKDRSITFEPELPVWKQAAIDNMGFGVLNKVILVYDKPFWDVDQDMFGLLRDTRSYGSLNQADYSWSRGRYYFFWNCIKTCGRPVLIALMAGEAAHHAEMLPDEVVVLEVTQQLAIMFKQKSVPRPLETIITRWGKDRFARGTYSYVGPKSKSGDYDTMAKGIGNLHFAGEATCGTHPATVHGAYISGLRAAAEVIDDLLGPISIPDPLVPARSSSKSENGPSGHDLKSTSSEAVDSPAVKQARLEAFEAEILKAIFTKLGPRPDKPGKVGANPFLLFSKDKWEECKAKCNESKRAALGNPNFKASRNEVRTALGQMWREASNDVKQPYIDKTVTNRAVNHESAATFQDRLLEWDAEAMGVRRDYVREHPGVLSREDEKKMWQAIEQALGLYGGGDRRAKKMSGYADGSGSEVDV